MTTKEKLEQPATYFRFLAAILERPDEFTGLQVKQARKDIVEILIGQAKSLENLGCK